MVSKHFEEDSGIWWASNRPGGVVLQLLWPYPSGLHWVKNAQISAEQKREKKVERQIPELVFLALYKHCLRKSHFKSIGKLMGNGSKEVGNSTLSWRESLRKKTQIRLVTHLKADAHLPPCKDNLALCEPKLDWTAPLLLLKSLPQELEV